MPIEHILSTAAVLSSLAVATNAFTLAENGKTSYTIVIPKNAIEPEKTAASELQSYLKQITGADFPICDESWVKDDSPQILIGHSKAAERLVLDLDWTDLDNDGILIRTIGNNLILAGGNPRGTLYAVYTFLEDTLGCRWWTGTESYIPSKSLLQIPVLDTKYAPKLKYRETFYRDVNENPLFAAKLKLNGHFNDISSDYGGHYTIIGWCHTFHQFLPPEKYFVEHPEWYSLIDGQRVDNKQLCLTNDEMRKEIVRVALDLIKKNPSSGIISISQNDIDGGNCQCENCKAIESEEGSPSGLLIRFVNSVAEDIQKVYPDMLVETLAYQYTLKPPAYVKPRSNVLIRLCNIGCDFGKPLDCDANGDFRDSMHKWSAIAPSLYVWDYVTDFASYMQPHPNMRVLAPNIRFFVANNTIGLFEQGDAGCSIGEFARLRAWVLAHLEWNPSADPIALTGEFLKGYYGNAAPYLRSYLDLIHDSLAKNDQKLSCYNTDLAFLTLDVMDKATKLFDNAEKAVVDDPVLSERVKRERMSLDYAWLLHFGDLKKEAAANNVPFNPPFDPTIECDRFIDRARKWNIGDFKEWHTFESYVPELKKMYKK
jgi:hypothetical protein